ncbi:MAG: nitroreductase [Chloroflexi bacterium]|nr:nitroreductase [Chloroflexota bacterium]
MTIEVLDRLIKSRRTVRDFSADPVSDATVSELIDAAVWAPNHRMTEPWRFFVLKKDGEGRKRVGDLIHAWTFENTPNPNPDRKQASADAARREVLDAPALVYAYSLSGDSDEIAEENYAAVACAVQNFMLAAHARGLGVGWSTGKVCKPPDLAATLGLTEPARISGCLYVGYPAAAPTSSRRDSSAVTTWL